MTKMGRPKELTKEFLINHGITNITRDGHVFTADGELTIQTQKKKSKYGIYYAHSFQIYDHDKYIENYTKDKNNKSGTITVILSRAIWAWHFDGINRPLNGNFCKPFTAPANLDIDHINNISTDDNFYNYQLLTRKQNLAKRRGHRNQYEASLVK